jgi:subtilase family serine protease
MRLELEELETRAMLSASGVTPAAAPPTPGQVKPLFDVTPQQTTSPPPGYSPQAIQQAYGIDTLLANGIDGKGETIAIVDSSYDPNIVSDVAAFNTQFGLPQFGAGSPTFSVVTSNGTPITSSNGPSLGEDANWAMETSLDVEWAHSIAPGANILLVETPLDNNVNDPQLADLLQGVTYAANHAKVVSMSWGENEAANETTLDNTFKQFPNVTFVAASGDNSALAGPIWPATSPYVLAVGGTTLRTTGGGGAGATSFSGLLGTSTVLGRVGGAGRGGGLYTLTGSTTLAAGSNIYAGESGWFGSGGGNAAYEGEPSFQTNALGVSNARMTPDVAFDANPGSGVAIYDSFQQATPWLEVGGTSVGAPSWSAIVALADQQRGSSLGTYQVETTLYSVLNTSNYTNVFHDITSGSNGFDAAPGYDLVTGLGSPIANNLVPLLAKTTVAPGLPTLTGTGTGPVSTATTTFAFTTFGFAAMGRAGGGGLYVTAGSPSITAGSQAATGLGSNAAGPSPTPAVIPSTSTPVSSLASAMISSTETPVERLSAGNLTGPGNNTLLASSLTTQAAPPVPVSNGNSLSGPSNAPDPPSTTVFGASGWNGPSNSSRLSSHDLHGPMVDDGADDRDDTLFAETEKQPDTALFDGDVSSGAEAPVPEPVARAANDSSAGEGSE